MSAKQDDCRICGAPPNTIGIITDENDAKYPCSACMGHEGVLVDRNFGVGVPGLIAEECYRLRDMLHEKNKNYGDSALRPLRIFSKADPVEAILVRLDDKLSRLARGSAAGEDVEVDLLGYLILLRVARRLKPGDEP